MPRRKAAYSKTYAQLEGYEELVRRLSDPRVAKDAVMDMIDKAIDIGHAQAIDSIRGGTESAIHSVQKKTWRRSMSGRVYTLIKPEKAYKIDEGRKPGDPPSIKQAARWHAKTIFVIITRILRSIAVAIQRAIDSRGGRGKHYIRETHDKVMSELPALEREVIERIGRWLSF